MSQTILLIAPTSLSATASQITVRVTYNTVHAAARLHSSKSSLRCICLANLSVLLIDRSESIC